MKLEGRPTGDIKESAIKVQKDDKEGKTSLSMTALAQQIVYESQAPYRP